jgi:hypothetical protein
VRSLLTAVPEDGNYSLFVEDPWVSGHLVPSAEQPNFNVSGSLAFFSTAQFISMNSRTPTASMTPTPSHSPSPYFAPSPHGNESARFETLGLDAGETDGLAQSLNAPSPEVMKSAPFETRELAQSMVPPATATGTETARLDRSVVLPASGTLLNTPPMTELEALPATFEATADSSRQSDGWIPIVAGTAGGFVVILAVAIVAWKLLRSGSATSEGNAEDLEGNLDEG